MATVPIPQGAQLEPIQAGGGVPVPKGATLEPVGGAPTSGAGGSFSDDTSWQPGWREKAISSVSSLAPDEELTHHIAQSFDLKNLGKNLANGAVGVADFAHGLGKDLLTNPNGPPLGQHSFFERLASGGPLDASAWQNLANAKNKYIDKPMQDEFQKAIEAGRQGRWSEALGHGTAGLLPGGSVGSSLGEQAGTGDIGGAAAKGVGIAAGGKLLEKAVTTPVDIARVTHDFLNRADGVTAVSNSASSVHKIAQEHLNLTIQSLKSSGERIIKDAVQADADQGRATGMPGTISTSGAIGESSKALSDLGVNVPQNVGKTVNKLSTGPARLTLQEAVQLRTFFNDAAFKAKGTQGGIVLSKAANELDQGIAVRFNELGDSKSWNTYNKKYTTAYRLQDNYSSILDPVHNRYASVEKMRDFADMNLYDVEREMKNQGMDYRIKDLQRTQADALRIVNAHDVLSKKMGASMFRLAMAEPGAAALGIGTAIALRPAAGIGAYLGGTMLANAVRRTKAAMEVGRLTSEYPRGPMEVTPDSGPDAGSSFRPFSPTTTPPRGSAPKAPPERRVTPGVAPGGVERRAPFEATEGASKTIERDPMMKAVTPRMDKYMTEARAKLGDRASNVAVANEAQRMRAMEAQGKPYQQSEPSKADRIQRIKKYNRSE